MNVSAGSAIQDVDEQTLRVVVLIPAHNEAASIADTIEAVLAQDRLPDDVVVIPNGCVDATADIARRYGVTVLELPRLEHKKSEALNTAWHRYASDADLVVCLDADTVLPPNAIADWSQEFLRDAERRTEGVRSLPLGGSSSKFTMRGGDFLTRLQRFEFARWTDTALQRGWTSVLAGTGCAISGEALRAVASRSDREGPWVYTSQVEDFELTYVIRQLGYRCQVSPTVRAYTDSMKTVRSLMGQRMKWQVGTVEDLWSIGVNRLTLLDWWQQVAGLFAAFARTLWLAVIVGLVLTDQFRFIWIWWVLPILFVAVEVRAALRIPHRDRLDVVLALLIIPSEIFAWLRATWFTRAWLEFLMGKITGRRKDHWQLQYAAEANRPATI
jgi:cellulose synthase/poly-beta-1,6-N-acetylglucosamine synthase-like glycosyltransferase